MESRLLRISNRYKSSGSMADFISCFTDAATYSCNRFELVSFQMPRLYPNVFYANNTLETSKGIFTVPSGQYDSDSLCSVLSELKSGIDFSQSCGYVIMKATENVTYYGSRSTIGRIIGEQRDIVMVTTTGSQLASSWICRDRPDLLGPELFLQIPSMTHALCSESSGNEQTSFIPLLCSIPTSQVEFGADIHYTPVTPIVFETQNPFSLNCVRVQLTDSWGNIITITSNSFCNFLIKYYYE